MKRTTVLMLSGAAAGVLGLGLIGSLAVTASIVNAGVAAPPTGFVLPTTATVTTPARPAFAPREGQERVRPGEVTRPDDRHQRGGDRR
ncbi:MAG: hypothetical protein K1X39_09135 [Thermoflexales bacterium]|nr:hypothetical protein [Thermoflexales bacterium]